MYRHAYIVKILDFGVRVFTLTSDMRSTFFAAKDSLFNLISDKKVRNYTLVSQKMSNLSKANFHCLP